MKTTETIIKKIVIECLLDDIDNAHIHLTENGYQCTGNKKKKIYGATVYFITGEKPYTGESE
jgi:hypothetical protein